MPSFRWALQPSRLTVNTSIPPMPLHGSLLQELVDQVIDEFGDAYQDPDHDKRSGNRLDACKALHACSLFSRDWAGRTREHPFQVVKIRGDEECSFAVPPDPSCYTEDIAPLILSVIPLRRPPDTVPHGFNNTPRNHGRSAHPISSSDPRYCVGTPGPQAPSSPLL